ncbi:hypothetical protein ACFRAQ_01460 [Nocardia sp. NPDC056611]|uniref:hypothetical protein n=1 Tax=Nocardia sp. NPDC056611 TaxID=3345877 RepID=UPI00367314EC
MDQILYWNAVALESDRMAHTDTGGSRALAVVHLAMHDAIFSIFGAPHGTWLTAPPVAAPGAAPEAAIAVAAHTTLSALYPERITRFDKALREAGLRGPGTRRGGHQGQAVAHAILRARADDPADPESGRDTPHHGSADAPTRFCNLMTREIAIVQGNDVEQNARLFALVNAALAGTVIRCGDDAACVGTTFRTIVGYYAAADGLESLTDDLWAAGLRQDQAAGPRVP